jgi:hypothetical protein
MVKTFRLEYFIAACVMHEQMTKLNGEFEDKLIEDTRNGL